MFQVGCPVKDFFLLVLGVPLDLSIVGVHKGSEVTQAPAEKRLKLVLRNWNRAVNVLVLLVLLPVKTDPVPKEGRSKENLVSPRSSSNSKVVLMLLTKVVLVYMGLFAIYDQETGI